MQEGFLSFHFQAHCGNLELPLIVFITVTVTLLVCLFIVKLQSFCSFLASKVRTLGDFCRKRRWPEEEYKFMMQHVSVARLMTKLLSKELLSDDERKNIENEGNEREKVTALLSVMLQKDDEKLRVFREIVENIYPGYGKGKGMSVKHRTALMKCRADIVRDLEPKIICSLLYSRELLNEEDKEWIDAAKTRTKKAERILDILPGKGDDAFGVLLAVLREGNAPYLAEKLEDECTEIQRKGNCHEESQSVGLSDSSSGNATENSGVNNLRVRIKNAMRNFAEEIRQRFSRKSVQSPNNEKTKRKMISMPNFKGILHYTPKMKSASPPSNFGKKAFSRRRKSADSSVYQRSWIVSHFDTRVSLERAHSALKKVLKDNNKLQESCPQKDEIHDILLNLDTENFRLFLEIAEVENPEVLKDCPAFSSESSTKAD